MSNKKLIIIVASIISTLLLCAAVLSVLNIAGIDLLKKDNNKAEIELAEINLDENNGTIEEQILNNKIKQLQNIDFSNDTRTNVIVRNQIESSRSGYIDRSLYVDIVDRKVQDDYVEVKSYIPRSEVKISFNMDVSKPCGLSKEDFEALVQGMRCDRTGILKANAGVIWEACQKYNVNEIFILGICGIESAWCSAPQHQRTHNYASLMSKGKLIQYATDADGFEAMIKLLGQSYLRPGAGLYHGATITGVGTCYCNTTTWPPKVFKCMQQALS